MLRGINRKDIFEDGLSTDIIQSLEKTKRNVVLRSALSFGAGIRQLSRLTGISYGVIQKLKNDQENPADPKTHLRRLHVFADGTAQLVHNDLLPL
jgi:hypothetical protein